MKSNEKFTQRAEIAIEAARAAAGELGHAYIGTRSICGALSPGMWGWAVPARRGLA